MRSRPGFESLYCDFQDLIGLYDPEFLLVGDKNNNAYLNGVVKIIANLEKHLEYHLAQSSSEQMIHTGTYTHP